MKNVAGYDVSRLLAGSMGVLGVICEVSLKVLPLAAGARPRCASRWTRPRRWQQLNAWGGQPLPLIGQRLVGRHAGAAPGRRAARRSTAAVRSWAAS